MESYFFVPASNTKFLERAKTLQSDYLILDLEDSVLTREVQFAIDNIKSFENKSRCFIRIPLKNEDTNFNVEIIRQLNNLNFHHFILPKIQSEQELENLVLHIPDLFRHRQILLVEHPKLLLQLTSILTQYNFFGIAFGSHDYTSVMQMEHTSENLLWTKHYLLNHAKAFHMHCLDLASMNIRDEHLFQKECQEAYHLGFDGKLIIHPMQLQVMNTAKFYSEEDLKLALHIRQKLKEVGGIENYNIHVIEGKVIERPHLKKYLDILKKEGYETI
ncbi:HpcH/HpaI aldolase/citrate lyase family protein [Catalinimonas niigatensis]|uniref:HpcH/HpaI aldolase/citrate lyase family protein n=1 Tax=Catalinimonas niigatensis TaxID=1397264 RepID=UPI002665CB04|nr:aldolase/citrate lyase family protein [Catalinimonas niigatensis]WPP53309.1 aldolase/citrate lyase family protein [Catalinimonas niigatensis]